MSQSQSNKADKPIHCIACGKVIGQGYIVEGSIKLLCRCGVKTKIEAEIKPESRQDVIVRVDTNAGSMRDIGMGRTSVF